MKESRWSDHVEAWKESGKSRRAYSKEHNTDSTQTCARPAHIELIAGELNIRPEQVQRTGSLLAEQATVPFISRYHKEATGGMDEVAINRIKERLERLENLEKRRATILDTIAEQGKLDDELTAREDYSEISD